MGLKKKLKNGIILDVLEDKFGIGFTAVIFKELKLVISKLTYGNIFREFHGDESKINKMLMVCLIDSVLKELPNEVFDEDTYLQNLLEYLDYRLSIDRAFTGKDLVSLAKDAVEVHRKLRKKHYNKNTDIKQELFNAIHPELAIITTAGPAVTITVNTNAIKVILVEKYPEDKVDTVLNSLNAKVTDTIGEYLKKYPDMIEGCFSTSELDAAIRSSKYYKEIRKKIVDYLLKQLK